MIRNFFRKWLESVQTVKDHEESSCAGCCTEALPEPPQQAAVAEPPPPCASNFYVKRLDDGSYYANPNTWVVDLGQATNLASKEAAEDVRRYCPFVTQTVVPN